MHFVVNEGDFASAFFELAALEPVARCAFLVEDPRCEFFLSCRWRSSTCVAALARAQRALRQMRRSRMAHNFSALCLSACPKPPLLGGMGGFFYSLDDKSAAKEACNVSTSSVDALTIGRSRGRSAGCVSA
jgi:hypothetical protein